MPLFADKTEFYNTKALKNSGKALLVRMDDDDGGEEIWFPHSQIDDDSEVNEVGDTGTLVVSLWIAGQKGLL